MNVDPKTGGELFIVDNSDEHWKGIQYLSDWTEIASAFDIATGFFEIGSLLALDGKWQKLEKIRILMGDEMTARTRTTLLEGLKAQVIERLDASMESEKEKNDFLTGVGAIVEAIKAGKLECRVYGKRKFHAKAYITHPRVSVIGSVALVGSSNFTYPGLTQNIELNVQIRTPGDVSDLQEWFERHWEQGVDVSAEVVRVMDRQIAEYTPFHVYTKALQSLFRNREMTPVAWDKAESVMYQKLDVYQREAYHSLLKISKNYRGAFLCDGVGLGKTFVGLQLIERLVLKEKKNVVLIVPKSGRESVWERNIRKHLPMLGGDFTNLVVINHSDLMRTSDDFPRRIQSIRERADVVIIDEAHHFRNRGLATKDEEIRSRYWKLYDLIREKQLFLLTATPVNNSLTDFQHLVELFTREDQGAFATRLGIHNIASHFIVLEKSLRNALKGEYGELFDQAGVEVEKLLFDDKLFREVVVQRSRSYVRKSQEQHGGRDVVFPNKEAPKVVGYSVHKTYGHLLGTIEKAFCKDKPLFALALYNPIAYAKNLPTEKTKEQSFRENRQKQVVRLIRLLFLKRFESSIVAFRSSCQTLMVKLIAFLRVNIDQENSVEVRRFEKWKSQNEDLLAKIQKEKALLDEEEEAEESEIGDDFIDAMQEMKLSRDEYHVDEIFDETYSDLETIVRLLHEMALLDSSHDDKLQSLIKLLKKKDLKGQKVILFTEFMSTARYLKRELIAAGLDGVDEIDSNSKRDRADVIQEFAPYYNESSSSKLTADGRDEIRILISTDVLSEGLNLQDSTRIVNYDIHWNPVRLMQRIGRVDRRMDPAIEKRLIADHPEQEKERGRVHVWNFLPPDELDGLLNLYSRVAHKTLRISKVFGIEGRKFLTPDDDFEALKDFNHEYEGEETADERLHLEYQRLIAENPALESLIDAFPGRLFSGKEHPSSGTKAVFFCYRLPAADLSQTPDLQWNGEADRTGWYLYLLSDSTIHEEAPRIADVIRSTPETPRVCREKHETLREIRLKVEAHIKKTYLRQVQAPVGHDQQLICWMEIC